MKKPPRFASHILRAVAVIANADPRSVRRFIDGGLVRPLCAARITAALAAMGCTDLIARADAARAAAEQASEAAATGTDPGRGDS